MNPWAGLELTATTDDGNLIQLYPNTFPSGSAATTAGALRRRPLLGTLITAQIETDGTNGGTIELWDIDGYDAGANVNTLNVITDTQLQAMLTAKKAQLIWRQNFTGTAGAAMKGTTIKTFTKGLAARFIAATGSCELNLTVDGGCRLTEWTGS